MVSQRGLVDPDSTSDARSPFADSAEANDGVYRMVEQQASWVGSLVAAVVPRTGGSADPQEWLFAQRMRFQLEGACDPWAEQMLYRAGLLPPRA